MKRITANHMLLRVPESRFAGDRINRLFNIPRTLLEILTATDGAWEYCDNVDRIDLACFTGEIPKAVLREWLARMTSRACESTRVTDPRTLAVVEALRADAVTKATHDEASEAVTAASQAAREISREAVAEKLAAAITVTACQVASGAAWAISTNTTGETLRSAAWNTARAVALAGGYDYHRERAKLQAERRKQHSDLLELVIVAIEEANDG